MLCSVLYETLIHLNPNVSGASGWLSRVKCPILDLASGRDLRFVSSSPHIELCVGDVEPA